jgi:ribosomal protein S27AE
MDMPGMSKIYIGTAEVRHTAMSRNYNKLWPEQARAKRLVQKAIQRGKIKKPSCCQMCGQPFLPNELQAHHHDYTRPLDVSWYCGPCHKVVHKELGKDWKDFNTQGEAVRREGG